MHPPPGVTDCHVHVYDSATPPAPGTPHVGERSLPQLTALLDGLGVSRVVLVQPSAYGVDNTIHLAAAASLGVARSRVVAVVPPGIADSELDRLDAAGVRGVRLNLVRPGPLPLAEFAAALAPRLAARGWHAQLHMTGDALLRHAETLASLPCSLVFDHLGRIPQPDATAHPGFATLRRLLDAGRTWVKLSAPYADSVAGPPDWPDAAALAAALLRHAPERMVWGSDWPHPSCPGPVPHAPDLLRWLAAAVPDKVAWRRVLADNPAKLYGFDA